MPMRNNIAMAMSQRRDIGPKVKDDQDWKEHVTFKNALLAVLGFKRTEAADKVSSGGVSRLDMHL